MKQTVPVSSLRPLVEAWIARHEHAQEAFLELEMRSGLKAGTWRKRFTNHVIESPRGTWRGWWSYAELDAADVDELLVAMDATDLWHTDLGLTESAGLVCEDCGRHITADTGYRPLDLFRPDPSSQPDIVWDVTKQRVAVRPGAAKAGGRRFRKYDLCRRCAGEALRVRASKNPKVGHKGRLGVLSTRDRVPPRRGGRPRLLTDPQLRNLHGLYLRQELSIGDLARGLSAGGVIAGTRSGFYQSILYGWRRLGLQLRTPSEAIALAHHRRGRKPPEKRRCPATTAKGTRCRLGPKAESIYCVSHQHFEAAVA